MGQIALMPIINGSADSRGVLYAPTLDERGNIRFARDSFAQRTIYCGVSMNVYSVMCGSFTQHENIKSNSVFAGVEFRAKDFDAVGGQCSGDIAAKPVPISRAYY
jgi:hypothetical protein